MNEMELKKLFEEHYGKLFNFALRWVFNPVMAEELVQEAFLALWEKSEKIEAASAKSYLFKTVQNKSINFLRRQKLCDFLNIDIMEFYAKDSRNSEVDLIQKEDIENMRATLEKIPFDYRKVLLLSYFGDFSQKEISQMLSVAEGTVASRKNRAMEILKSNFHKGASYAL